MKKTDNSNPVPGGEYGGVSDVKTPEIIPYPAPTPAFDDPNDGQSITRSIPGACEDDD